MSRKDVFAAVRASLGANPDDKTRQQSVTDRLSRHARNTVPAVGQLSGDERLAQFAQSAEQKGASVFQLENPAAAAEKILAILPEGAPIAMTRDVLRMGLALSAVPWQAKTSLENCVSTCFCGVAESGSLAIISDEGNALSQNFLSDRHFVLLPEADILDAMESVWEKLREQGGMPRDLTLVSGPSSTGDIEMRMERGAHGPRELIILIVRSL